MRLKRFKLFLLYSLVLAIFIGAASCGNILNEKAPHPTLYNLSDHQFSISATRVKTVNDKAIFEGKIAFKFGDLYRIFSDKLVIKHLGKKPIQNLSFAGNVEFTFNSKMIKSNNAFSENPNESIEFYGNPVIFENGVVQNCYRYIYFYNGAGHCILQELNEFSANQRVYSDVRKLAARR